MVARAFICYARKDTEYVDDLVSAMAPDVNVGNLELWFDRKIRPAAEWNEEIHEAIARSNIAVLIVSRHFYASDYIRDTELPALVAARAQRRMDLAVIYASPARPEDVLIRAVDGEAALRLTDLQGLNSPGTPLSADEPGSHRREEAWRHIGQRLNTLTRRFLPTLLVHERTQCRLRVCLSMSRHGLGACRKNAALRDARPDFSDFCVAKPSNTRSIPAVSRLELEKSGRTSLDRYFPDRLLERRVVIRGAEWGSPRIIGASVRDAALAGDARALGQIVLGPTSEWGALLRTVYDTDAAARPIYGPVRVTVATDDDRLAALPWRWATDFDDKPLTDHGWCFELSTDARHPPLVALHVPAPVVVLGPPGDRTESQRRAITDIIESTPGGDRLGGLGLGGPGLDAAVAARDLKTFAAHLADRPGAIAYVIADTRRDEAGVQIDLGPQSCTFDALAGVFARRPPKLCVLDLYGLPSSQLVGPARALHRRVPLVVVRPNAEPPGAWHAWLRTTLTTETDPVEALARQSPPGAFAYAAFDVWQTVAQALDSKLDAARTRLDRSNPRHITYGLVSELCQSADRRILVLVALGAAGNRVEDLADNLIDYLEPELEGVACIGKLAVPLPADRTADRMMEKLRERLDVQRYGNLSQQLGRRAPRGAGIVDGRPTLFIDWGTCGAGSAPGRQPLLPPVDLDELEAWIELCGEQLVSFCPDDMRLVCYLGIQVRAEWHADVVADLDAVVNARAVFTEGPVRFAHLPPLGDVQSLDIANFLDLRDNSSCPRDLAAEMTRLLRSETDGRFDAVVELIERAEAGSWYALYRDLREKHRTPTPKPKRPRRPGPYT